MGVVSNFFYPRWELFIMNMNKTLQKGTRFNETLVKQEMFKNVEEPFTFDRSLFPTEPSGEIKISI
ncbi:hypothetical protein NQ314_005171 [Rhamnusium bicolor]|uniref:Alpha-N-acetylglucosaminidase C-terminal domain-containing protein n=1 Tax=Rhamnusium bicolor TaxID=1586634 RepID=A0AAV8ZH63_9CUCU|nr:hypothetical protein NQ314_005171 [Rhamnusium bicolor]